MRISFVLLIFCAMSMSIQAQSKQQTITCSDTNNKWSSGVNVSGYTLQQPETVYDLALNLSYTHHIQQKDQSETLTLPIVSLEDKPVALQELKEMKMDTLMKYEFSAGAEVEALYGLRGNYGLLRITVKK